MKIDVKYIPEPLGVIMHDYDFDIILTNRWGGRNHAVCLLGARLWDIDKLERILPFYDKALRQPHE